MASRFFDDWLKSFVEYASYGEAPLKMLFWTGVSTVAGALRRKVWIDQKFFRWVPNFYIVMVAPPGIVGKSTTANVGMNLLRQLDGIHFGPDVVTWQALVQSMAKSTEGVPDPATGEYHIMSAITIASDEFGVFLNPDNGDMVDVLVSLWDGKQGTFDKVTKTAGSDKIENPWINLIACTTPDWISGRFPEYLIGGGFTSRCVFLYADKKRQEVPYIDEVVPKGFDEFRQRLIHDLEVISTMFGEYTLSADARTWGKAWYSRHWSNKAIPLNSEQYAGYMARKQTHIHKLAMVIAASQNGNLVIEQPHLETAEAMITALEKDMPKVFSKIGQTEVTKGASTIVSITQRAGKIDKAELYKELFRTMSYQDFSNALTSAINAGLVRLDQHGSIIYVVAVGAP